MRWDWSTGFSTGPNDNPSSESHREPSVCPQLVSVHPPLSPPPMAPSPVPHAQLPERSQRCHNPQLLLNRKVEQSKASFRTTKPRLCFLLKGHQLLGAVRMIRQPGLHNKEDIQANNFPLGSSELDVFHPFLQGGCQGLFAPLTQRTLEGIWLGALL